MSFRTENKFILPINKNFEFKNWLIKNKYSTLYKKRSINSVYFDTKNFMIYKDSIEGTTPRKKIRIRTYSNKFLDNSNEFNLEIKISSIEGRYKKKEKIKKEINKLLNGIYDYQYGRCFPVLNVIYEREYFIKNYSRITIDTNIKYFIIKGKFISSHGQKESCFVVENKSKDLVKNEMLNFFPFENKRFSKYCNGIEKIYKLNYF